MAHYIRFLGVPRKSLRFVSRRRADRINGAYDHTLGGTSLDSSQTD